MSLCGLTSELSRSGLGLNELLGGCLEIGPPKKGKGRESNTCKYDLCPSMPSLRKAVPARSVQVEPVIWRGENCALLSELGHKAESCPRKRGFRNCGFWRER